MKGSKKLSNLAKIKGSHNQITQINKFSVFDFSNLRFPNLFRRSGSADSDESTTLDLGNEKQLELIRGSILRNEYLRARKNLFALVPVHKICEHTDKFRNEVLNIYFYTYFLTDDADEAIEFFGSLNEELKQLFISRLWRARFSVMLRTKSPKEFSELLDENPNSGVGNYLALTIKDESLTRRVISKVDEIISSEESELLKKFSNTLQLLTLRLIDQNKFNEAESYLNKIVWSEPASVGRHK